MKKNLVMKVFIVLVVLCMLLSVPAAAAVDADVIKTSSETLVKLQLMKGDEKGNLKLNDKVTRCEFITLVIRMLEYENNTDTSDVNMPFKDISQKHWAYNNIKIALKLKLVNGYVDNTVRPDNFVDFTEAQAILVRALGYESTLTGNWPDNVLNKAAELQLNKKLDLAKDKQLTRGETSVLIYNSLSVNFNK